MLLYHNDSNDPYFNLAAEEYLMDSAPYDTFMLWRNRPCVVIGKNQNAYAEIDMDFVADQEIAVVRRNSGGGAVFHDLGNVNFTFISRRDGNVSGNFRRFTQPIIEALTALGINAEFSGRNDITVNGLKVSGNAQYYRNDKIMHHGTLLFSGDMKMLAAALQPNRQKLINNGVASVRARVVNICDLLPERQSVEWFLDYLRSYVISANDEERQFNRDDLRHIEKLCSEKYITWDWNFGAAPQFDYEREARFAAGTVCLAANVQRGVIRNAKISGDFFGEDSVEELSAMFAGIRFTRGAVEALLRRVDFGKYIAGMNVAEFSALLPRS